MLGGFYEQPTGRLLASLKSCRVCKTLGSPALGPAALGCGRRWRCRIQEIRNGCFSYERMENLFPSLGLLPKWLQKLELSQAKIRSLMLHPGFSGGWQRAQGLSCPLLPPKVLHQQEAGAEIEWLEMEARVPPWDADMPSIVLTPVPNTHPRFSCHSGSCPSLGMYHFLLPGAQGSLETQRGCPAPL